MAGQVVRPIHVCRRQSCPLPCAPGARLLQLTWRDRGQSEVEETMKKLGSYPGFMGYVIINADGIPIRSSLDHQDAVQYAGLLSTLCQKSRAAVRELDPSNDVTFLRLRSHKHEILVAPDKEYVLVVIQAPQVKPPAPAAAKPAA